MPFRQSLAAFALVCCGASLAAADDSAAQSFQLHLRTSRETKQGSGQFVARIDDAHWDARKTAVVICDMWDQHWCRGASERVAEMAPRMNKVVAAARARGALIVHCPSDTMDAYKDTPQRKLAAAAPVVAVERPLERWCRLDDRREAGLPIDDKDGGCDCQPTCQSRKAWSRQIAAIEIA
ncbi:MAG: protein-signal peptide and transmembrane prediction, partial [Planctomycetales bacterium]|nr:protein-signal peptide and transmembrane prediction [Planctomycetales bacterium]